MLLADAAPVLEARAEELRLALERLASLEAEAVREQSELGRANEELASRRDILGDLLAEKQRERDEATRLAEAVQAESPNSRPAPPRSANWWSGWSG